MVIICGRMKDIVHNNSEQANNDNNTDNNNNNKDDSNREKSSKYSLHIYELLSMYSEEESMKKTKECLDGLLTRYCSSFPILRGIK